MMIPNGRNMMILFHLDSETGLVFTPADARAVLANSRPGMSYRLVGAIFTDDLERLFELTNHIDGDWTMNPACKVVGVGQQRSTSVGDVVMDKHGIFWLCARVGWQRVYS